MFKKTETTSQMDMFTSPEMYLCQRASKKYSDPKAWQNQFFRHLTSKVDESLFKVLFPKGKKSGRPNASIRVLVAMSALKEGFGCSDADLFEKCDFDMLTRRALGLDCLGDAAPSIDTWYLFRRRIYEYQEETGIDLMQQVFEQITREQIQTLEISGKCIRMDSKLIGSNIARQSRYELIHKTLEKFLKDGALTGLPEELREKAEDYLKEDSSKTVYRSDSETLQSRLQTIGEFIHAVLGQSHVEYPHYDLLRRVFGEQYTVSDDGRVQLRDKRTVSSNSVQNPNDPEASFRDKHGQKVQGYVTNITETVEEGKPSVITSVQVETATFADCHFVEQAVENSERVTKSTIEDLYADGAYQSPENRKFAEEHGGMNLKTGKMQGGARWELIPHDHDDGLTVREIATGNTYEAVKAKNAQGKRARWRIPWNNNTGWRYFEDKDIEAYKLRKQIESLPPEEQHKRNNVEAAMFQYSFHTRNGKTRYRGLLKHRMQAYARSMWMNLRRLVIFQFFAFKRTFFALLESLGGAFGYNVVMCMRPAFEDDAFSVFLKMTVRNRQGMKNSPFSSGLIYECLYVSAYRENGLQRYIFL